MTADRTAFIMRLGGRPFHALPKSDGPGYTLVPALHPAMVQAMAPMMTAPEREEPSEA